MSHRLLIITELFLPTKGGTAVWFAEVYRRLGGRDIQIVTADVPGAEALDAGHENAIHRISLRRVPWLKPESLLMYWRLFSMSLRLAMASRFEAVHAGRALPEGFVAWAVARLVRIPCIVYAHGEELTTWGNGAKYELMRFVLRRANRVVANSEYTREVLIRIGVDASRISIINPGVDVDIFRPGLPHEDLIAEIGLKQGQKLILSVGRMQMRKGFDKVLDAIPSLVSRGHDVHYALIGIGEHLESLRGRAAALGVSSRVHFLGHVGPGDLPRWYNACDVFAMPNREIDGDTEGFGMVFLEAAACGKCAIAGKAGGTGSAVIDGKTGIRVDGTSSTELVNALDDLLGNAALRQSLGQNACNRVQSELSWEHVARKTAELIQGTRAETQR